jgi:5-methylcytosine-specific restriction protein B
MVQQGDLVIGYQTRPDQRIVALAEVTKTLADFATDPGIEIKPIKKLANGLSFSDLQNDPILQESEPMRNNCRGTLFALSGDEAQYLFSLLKEKNPELSKYMTSGEGIGHLTWATFHPSYTYEDFVEGYRPVESSGGGLKLRLEDGVFKRICREAQSHPKQNYLILIDEINRANLAKVFGELITLMEKDKRGIQVTLPQSKESFTVPPNVFILGTMNTADRSIKLMDTALRRRFSFIELMPDSTLLHGARIINLPLDEFLDTLNRRLAENEGREKQIGHAFLLDQGQPISQPEEFARRFRQEILPLLQEYCYEEYDQLASYLGDQIVDAKGQTLNTDFLKDDEKLIEALTALVLHEG